MKVGYNLPSGWDEKMLDEVTVLMKNGFVGTATEHYTDEPDGITYIQGFNVTENGFNLKGIKKVTVEFHKKNINSRLQENDLLTIQTGDVGLTTIVPKELEGSNCHALVISRFNKEICYPQYYVQLFNSPVCRRLFRGIETGSSMKHLNVGDMKKLRVPVPPLSEQIAIADLLSAWDKAIEQTEQLVKVKQSQLKYMSKKLLFGHSRIGDKKSDMNESHFFKYPADWDLVNVGSIARELSLRNGECDTTVLSCSKYDGFVNSLDYFGKQVFSSDTSNYKVIEKGQFGYPSNHIEEGSIGLLEHCEKGIVSPIYVVFEVDSNKVYAPYLYKLFKTDVYRHIFQVSTSSSVDRRGSLRWGDFSKIKILLPTLNEQKKIAGILLVAEQEIKLLRQLAMQYRKEKVGLMQRLLIGEWRVNIDKEVA